MRHGTLSSLVIQVPAPFADRWELVEHLRGQDVERQQELGREPGRVENSYRLSFDRPVLDQTTLRFRYRLPLAPVLDSGPPRTVSIPWIMIKEGEAGSARVGLTPAPEEMRRGSVRTRLVPLVGRPSHRGCRRGSGHAIRSQEILRRGRPLHVQGSRQLAWPGIALPGLIVPRLLIRTIRGVDASARTTARYWVESHGIDFAFALPEGAQWIEARVDGRIADRVDYDRSRSQYRLRFPGDAVSRPALVELEYQQGAPVKNATWRAPQLLDGAVILQALWEVRLPWSMAFVGIPSGWSDENQWSWTGYSWNRRPGKDSAGLNEWLLGAASSTTAIDDFTGTNLDDSDRYLFSERGEPAALKVWVVPRIVAGRALFGSYAGHRLSCHVFEASIPHDLAGGRWSRGACGRRG